LLARAQGSRGPLPERNCDERDLSLAFSHVVALGDTVALASGLQSRKTLPGIIQM